MSNFGRQEGALPVNNMGMATAGGMTGNMINLNPMPYSPVTQQDRPWGDKGQSVSYTPWLTSYYRGAGAFGDAVIKIHDWTQQQENIDRATENACTINVMKGIDFGLQGIGMIASMF